MRNAVNTAQSAATNAGNTSATLGGEAQGIGANLTPFLTQEMEHPQGFGQGDTSAMVAAGLGGAGGANSGLVGEAAQRAGASRNSGGFQAALDDAARMRSKAAAGASENIAGENANLKQQQTQEGAAGLGKLYGTDTSGMLGASGQVAPDINAEVNANKTGWLQDANQLLGLGQGVGTFLGDLGNGNGPFAGFQGGK